jgi:hypothetical protein
MGSKWVWGLVAAPILGGLVLLFNYLKQYYDDREAGLGLLNIPRDTVIVTVGDTQIKAGDIDWEYKFHTKTAFVAGEFNPLMNSDNKDEKKYSSLKEKLMVGIVERKLLYKYIQKEGRTNLSDPSLYVSCVEEWQQILKETTSFAVSYNDSERLKSRLCEQSIIQHYLDKIIYPKIAVTEKEAESYFQLHKKEYHKPTRAVIKHMVLPIESQARSVHQRVNAKNFSDYAKDLSISPDAEQGGRIGPFAKGEMPQVFDIAFSMRVGEISSVVKSTHGYHIIMLEQKLDDETPAFKDLKGEIERQLIKQKREEAYKAWVEKALDTISVSTPKSLM